MVPEYAHYTLEQLEDARRNIDAERYPERLRALEIELKRREAGIGKAIRRARCQSCQGGLEPATVRPLLARSIYVTGFIGEIYLWIFGALVAGLFSLSFWLAGFIVSIIGVAVLLLYGLRSVDGYICKQCGAQYAPWQVKNEQFAQVRSGPVGPPPNAPEALHLARALEDRE